MFSKETETVSMLRKMLTGVGFMADTYDLFVINMVVDIMKDVYSISQLEETLIKTSALFGAVIGQIAFGYFADKIGRKWIFVSTCLLTICGSIGSAVVGNSGGWTVSQWLIFARFFLGIGIGGEYPLSATITAENNGLTDDEVITNLSLTFSMQGVGQILCGIVLILITQFVNEPNLQWRLALGFGALPMIVSFFYRWHMDETKHFKEIVQQQQTQNRPNNTRSSYLVPLVSDQGNTNNSGQLSIWDSIRANWIQLLGAAGSWFLLDIVFYGNGLFSSSITEAMGTADGNKSKAVQVFILQLISFPGYFCSVWFLAKQGCKVIQDRGFIAITLIFAIMALLQPYLKTVGPLYIIIYGLTFFFENYGANTTTFIIPAITFPTNSRATCHGISAAAGKLGAIFGVFILSYLKNSFCSGGECNDDDETGNIDKGLQLTFGFCAFIGILGYLWSYFFVLTDKVDKTLNVVNSETEATTTA